MKWIRWDGNCYFERRGNAPDLPTDENCVDFIGGDFIDCEKDKNWREIESGVYDIETGKLRITLKPVEKVPTLREAVENYLEIAWSNYREAAANSRKINPRDCLVQLVDALDREASAPTNPYTKEAVDELLDAAKKQDRDNFDEDAWSSAERKLMARAFLTLKKQREAGRKS